MTVPVKINFLHLLDFLTIAIDAYKNSQEFIYKKILATLSNQLHNSYIDLEKVSLELNDDSISLCDYDLEFTYDFMLDSIESIKLFKAKIKNLDNDNFEFTNLYNEADKMHDIMLSIVNRLTDLEIEELKKEDIVA